MNNRNRNFGKAFDLIAKTHIATSYARFSIEEMLTEMKKCSWFWVKK